MIRRHRHALPLWRLDLDTETLLKDDIAEWSNEEISAWLDWKEVQDQEATREADREAEAELIKAGGYGRSKEVLEGSGIKLTLILRLEMYNIGSQIRVLYDKPKYLILGVFY